MAEDYTQLIQKAGVHYTMNPFSVMMLDPTTDVLIARANTLSESGCCKMRNTPEASAA